MSFVYGHLTVANRKPMWNNLTDYSKLINGGWMAVGDYDAIFKVGHIMKGNEVCDMETQDGVKWMTKCDMNFAKPVGNFYLWNSRGTSQGRIHSKIDHFVCNEAWRLSFGECVVHYKSSSIFLSLLISY